MKRFLCCVLVACMLFLQPGLSQPAHAMVAYDRTAAVQYAANNWDNGVGVCDEFVKACLKAGGITINSGYVTYVYRELLNYGTSWPISFTNGICYNTGANEGHMEAGDIICWYCDACAQPGQRYEERPWPHIAIINRIDDNHIVRFAAHNGAEYDSILRNQFYHDVDGERHSGSSIGYYVVHIDTDAAPTPDPQTEYMNFGDKLNRRIRLAAAPSRASLVSYDTSIFSHENVFATMNWDTANQDWCFRRQTDGSYIIQNYWNTNLVLEVKDSGTAEGTNIQVGSKTSADNQKWFIRRSGNGFALVPKHAQNMALTCESSSFEAGANICLKTYANSNTQWILFDTVKYEPMRSLSLNKKEITLEVGQRYMPRPYISPAPALSGSDADAAKLSAITSISSNSNVVQGYTSGIFVAKQAGTATVSVKSKYNESVYDTITVTVVNPVSETRTVLPADLTTVEEWAFYGTDLSCVVIPDTCTRIDDFAFAWCQSLRHVYIPAALTDISFYAFTDSANVVIYTPAGSPAVDYAKAHGFPWYETE